MSSYLVSVDPGSDAEDSLLHKVPALPSHASHAENSFPPPDTPSLQRRSLQPQRCPPLSKTAELRGNKRLAELCSCTRARCRFGRSYLQRQQPWLRPRCPVGRWVVKCLGRRQLSVSLMQLMLCEALNLNLGGSDFLWRITWNCRVLSTLTHFVLLSTNDLCRWFN